MYVISGENAADLDSIIQMLLDCECVQVDTGAREDGRLVRARQATDDWCESPLISQLHLLRSTMLKTTTSTPYKPTWSTRWSSGISGGRILTSSVWAASFYPCTRTVLCTAPRSFPRQSSWRTNVFWSTSKTMTKNASFGACCRRYTHPLTIHIV